MLRHFFARNHYRRIPPSQCVVVEITSSFSSRRSSSSIHRIPLDLPTILKKPLVEFISDEFEYQQDALAAQLPSHNITVISYINGDKLWGRLSDVITSESSKRLLPGNVQRHTAAFPYGILARKAAIEQASLGIDKIEKNSSANVRKETRPLILVVGITRQGKTAFLDNVANNFDGALDFAFTNLRDPSSGNVFCVNITFNSHWPLKEGLPFESGKHAFEQFAIRAIAAAANTNEGDEKTKNVITPIVEFVQPDASQLLDLLRSKMKKLYPSVNPFFVFLADEITNFDRLLPNETMKVAFSTEINNLVSFRSAVVQSGFTSAFDSLTLSGRPCHNCVLQPLSSPELRRQASAMSTMFFQQIALAFALKVTANKSLGERVLFSHMSVRNFLKASYFYFELLKSSAGLLGAILETVVSFEASSLLQRMKTMRVFDSIDLARREKINRCLAWKSIQFCSYKKDQTSYVSGSITHEAFFAMTDDCLDAGTSKLAYLPTSLLQWKVESGVGILGTGDDPLDEGVRRSPTEKSLRRIELDAKRRQDDGRVASSLSQISVEPSYVFFSRENESEVVGEFFKIFAQMLMNYSIAMHALPYLFKAPSSEFSDVFRKELEQSGLKGCKEAAPLLRRIVGKRFLTNATRYDAGKHDGIDIQTDSQGRDTSVTAYFFEDAVTVGINAQKELRASLYENRAKTDVTKLDASIDDFLEGSRIFPSLDDQKTVPTVRWIDKEIKHPTAPKCFTGSFPLIAPNSGSCSICLNDFNRNTVLRPERPESNALVDVIFHERIAGEEGLVQFWVDAKHRHARYESINQGSDVARFAHLVIQALKNPILQGKSASGTRIIHSVVHIIVSPKVQVQTELHDAFKNKFAELPKSQQLCLPNYYFYFVNPDTVAFENLVSQPIARAIPLMDQQCLQSWRQRCGGNLADWVNYKATLQHHGLEHVINNDADFCEWRQLRLLDDAASTLRSCFRDSSDSENFIRELLSSREVTNVKTMKRSDNEIDDDSVASNNKNSTVHDVTALSLLSFGAILEKIGVLGNQANNDDRLTYLGSELLCVQVHNEDADVIERESRLIVTSKISSNKPFALNLRAKKFPTFLREKVTIGHLMDGHHDEFDQETSSWNVLFDDNFFADLDILLASAQRQVQVATRGGGGRTVYYVDSRYWQENTTQIAIMLYNMPFKIWRLNSILFEGNKKKIIDSQKTTSWDIASQSVENFGLRKNWHNSFYFPAGATLSKAELFRHQNSEVCFLLKMMQWKCQTTMNQNQQQPHQNSAFLEFMAHLDVRVNEFEEKLDVINEESKQIICN